MPSFNDQNVIWESMLAPSVEARGTVTAPTAGTDIVSVSLSPGYWEITAIIRLGTGGTPAAGDVDNARLRNNTSATNELQLPLIAVANGTPVPVTVRRKFTATTSYVIEAVGAGSASVVYIGHLVARKIADL